VLEAVLRIEYLYQNARRLIVREPGVLAQQRAQAGALLFQVRRVVGGDNLAAQSLNLIGDVIDFHTQKVKDRAWQQISGKRCNFWRSRIRKFPGTLGIAQHGVINGVSGLFLHFLDDALHHSSAKGFRSNQGSPSRSPFRVVPSAAMYTLVTCTNFQR
jgi:hypothetical protein